MVDLSHTLVISVPRKETTMVLSGAHRHTAACVSVLEFSTKQTFSYECGFASRPRTCRPFCDASTAQSPSVWTAHSADSNSRWADSLENEASPPAIAPAAAPAASEKCQRGGVGSRELMVWGFRSFRVYGLGCRVQGLGFRV